ncbi:4'-phosphopantetheinyl transferase [Flavobacterium noncentrifugens]|uniref:Phosphopantetheinyl transferase n=1 Tax=Flavobacterium noncentrifugens TaxID=1128970 RepID=A0A1G8S4B7_9FLAO|nr:4'-phosphopantetheinyl transferase superfamily protein [Flavobacterium noncentrifugens]GEP49690.1 4'-phosphopantetheinyl transferase [Flavobacterium noncentrifugens]SDJ24104.1 Phosphopantetheinyl transferase [Flavobacterium noncentrifugens]
MPLYKIINFSPKTQIYIWKIDEPYAQLREEVQLNDRNEIRLNGMKSELHRRGFLSVRKILHENGYSDFDLTYDAFGKPHLKDGKHLSITHSHEFSAVIFSDQNIGIDMEKQRDKIKILDYKFAEFEMTWLDKNAADYMRKLTVVWGVKEAIFKIRNEVGISFNDHIFVQPFEMQHLQTDVILNFNETRMTFSVYFEEMENFTLVYVLEK